MDRNQSRRLPSASRAKRMLAAIRARSLVRPCMLTAPMTPRPGRQIGPARPCWRLASSRLCHPPMRCAHAPFLRHLSATSKILHARRFTPQVVFSSRKNYNERFVSYSSPKKVRDQRWEGGARTHSQSQVKAFHGDDRRDLLFSLACPCWH